MRGYDWGFGFGFGPRHRAHRSGYERGEYGAVRGTGRAGWAPWRAEYDRGVYGEDYPAFGGVPGSAERGMYYGGRRRGVGGYARDFERGGRPGAWPGGTFGRGGAAAAPYGRYDAGFGPARRGRYDRDFAGEPFLPESAYRRHPELDRPQPHRPDRWPDRGHELGGRGRQLDDEEIRRAIRNNLYQDGWIDAEQIDVEVDDGVVTLRGEVDDYLQARYAWDDAWETEGVRGVINQLTVRTDRPAGEQQAVLQTAGRTAAQGGEG